MKTENRKLVAVEVLTCEICGLPQYHDWCECDSVGVWEDYPLVGDINETLAFIAPTHIYRIYED